MDIITAVTWVTDVVRVQSLAGELPHVECVAKKSEHIMPFAPTRMKLKSERKRQIPSGITYMWNLKHGTNETSKRHHSPSVSLSSQTPS